MGDRIVGPCTAASVRLGWEDSSVPLSARACLAQDKIEGGGNVEETGAGSWLTVIHGGTGGMMKNSVRRPPAMEFRRTCGQHEDWVDSGFARVDGPWDDPYTERESKNGNR